MFEVVRIGVEMRVSVKKAESGNMKEKRFFLLFNMVFKAFWSRWTSYPTD